MQRAKGRAVLPDVPLAAQDHLGVFLDLDKVHSNGMGFSPLPYAEIAACAPWMQEQDRRVVRDMSRAYLDGYKIGEDPFGIPPYSDPPDLIHST